MSAWAGQILLPTAVETPGITEQEKIIQIFLRGSCMHILHKNQVERGFKTVSDRMNEKSISLFAFLLFFSRSPGKED